MRIEIREVRNNVAKIYEFFLLKTIKLLTFIEFVAQSNGQWLEHKSISFYKESAK